MRRALSLAVLSAAACGRLHFDPIHGFSPTSELYLKASNTSANDNFGYSVALSADGSTLAVGAPGEASAATGVDGNQADTSAARSGAVYIFARHGISWSQEAYIKASNTD